MVSLFCQVHYHQTVIDIFIATQLSNFCGEYLYSSFIERLSWK